MILDYCSNKCSHRDFAAQPNPTDLPIVCHQVVTQQNAAALRS